MFRDRLNRSGGVVIDIHQGVPGAPTANTAAALTGIACDAATRLAVGGQPSEHDGVLLGLSLSGKATSMQVVPGSGGFTAVAAPLIGNGFVATGPALSGGTEVASAP